MKSRFQPMFFALVWLALLIFSLQNSTVFAQGTTTFVYQGKLSANGTNASGNYTLIFKIFDAASGGNQIGAALTNDMMLSNGLFTAALDFGSGAFNGDPRWLEITVTNGATPQTLSPRTQLLASPYAQFAAVAAGVTNGAVATAQIANGSVTDAKLSTNSSVVRMQTETNLVIIRGTIDSAGNVVAGQGFTVQVTSSTTRTISFTTPFTGQPTITLGQHGSSGNSIVDLVTSSGSSFSTVANGSAGFDFIAIGPR